MLAFFSMACSAKMRKDYIHSNLDSNRVRRLSEFVVLSRLTAEGRKTLKNKPERLKEVNKEIEKMGAKVLKQYALLGKYDFLTILEAPDNETVATVMVELGSRGSLETTTMAAMNIDDFLKSLK
jgi:uncharacterized protein with GYD domain